MVMVPTLNLVREAKICDLMACDQSGRYEASGGPVASGAGSITGTVLNDGTTYTKTVQLSKTGTSSGLTTVAAGGTASAPGGLLGGDIDLYVDNTNGDLTDDELARIQDAVTAVDAVTAPYGVAVQEVSDPTRISPSSMSSPTANRLVALLLPKVASFAGIFAASRNSFCSSRRAAYNRLHQETDDGLFVRAFAYRSGRSEVNTVRQPAAE